MTKAEWLAATDPNQMIWWMSKQGYLDALWEFTATCSRRIIPELHGVIFGPAIEYVENLGSCDVQDLLAEVWKALDKLERRLQKTDDPVKEAKLNRQIGYGRMLLAFDYQDVSECAEAISSDLIEWASDADEERRHQADLLRQLVTDPTESMNQDEDDEEE